MADCFGFSRYASERITSFAGGVQVGFQWKNPDFLFKNPDFLLRNPDFLSKNPDFLLKNVDFTIMIYRSCVRMSTKMPTSF